MVSCDWYNRELFCLAGCLPPAACRCIYTAACRCIYRRLPVFRIRSIVWHSRVVVTCVEVPLCQCDVTPVTSLPRTWHTPPDQAQVERGRQEYSYPLRTQRSAPLLSLLRQCMNACRCLRAARFIVTLFVAEKSVVLGFLDIMFDHSSYSKNLYKL
jgi:hypothetical protein